MRFLTFGTVILFKNEQYVWLVPDPEEGKIHLAWILNKEKTELLRGLDDKNAKKPYSDSGSPAFAYVILTTEEFNGCAAHLGHTDEHAEKKDVENKDNYSILRELNEYDLTELKEFILKEGARRGVMGRLVTLVKKLDDDKQEQNS